jgi:hypothetical protein
MGRVFGEGDKNHARRRFARRAEEGRFSKNKGLAVYAGTRAEKIVERKKFHPHFGAENPGTVYSIPIRRLPFAAVCELELSKLSPDFC